MVRVITVPIYRIHSVVTATITEFVSNGVVVSVVSTPTWFEIGVRVVTGQMPAQIQAGASPPLSTQPGPAVALPAVRRVALPTINLVQSVPAWLKRTISVF